jgi:hypothetical protein
MTASMTAPQDTYARLLFSEGRGYPLWDPTPHDQAPDGLRIGEIGWLDNGQFIILVPSLKVEMDGDLPRGYQVRQDAAVKLIIISLPPLNPEDLRSKLYQYLPRAMICYTTQNRSMLAVSRKMDLYDCHLIVDDELVIDVI